MGTFLGMFRISAAGNLILELRLVLTYLTENYLQIGDWRFGKIDENHFSVTHKDGKTAVIYKTDGTVHRGPRTDVNA